MKEEEFLIAVKIPPNALYEKFGDSELPYELIQEEFPGATEIDMPLGAALSVPWPYCLLSLATLISSILHRVRAKMENILSTAAHHCVALTGISGGGKSPPVGVVGANSYTDGEEKI